MSVGCIPERIGSISCQGIQERIRGGYMFIALLGSGNGKGCGEKMRNVWSLPSVITRGTMFVA